MSAATDTRPAAKRPPTTPPRRKSSAGSARSRRGVSGWAVLAVLAAMAVLMIFPFWLALINAFKPQQDYLAGGPIGVPTELDFTAIESFWTGVDFNRKLLNSVILSASVALMAAVLSLLSAFAIGIGRVKGRVWILATFMLAFTIPQEALVYPLFVLTRELNLYDTLFGVAIILAVLQSAFGTYMLSSVLGSFPMEILEAARLDGATRFQILRLVVLPLTRPTLSVLITFFFIWTWNDFFLPLILLPSSANQTVSVSLGALSGQYTSDPTALAAASMAGILPAVIFFLLFQRTLMRGVNIGAIK